MAVFSRSHCSRKRRVSCSWKLTVTFLVLSQSALMTLQCGSAKAGSRSKAPINTHSSWESFNGNEVSNSPSEEIIGLRQHSSVPYIFQRVARNTGHHHQYQGVINGGGGHLFQFCSNRLIFELRKVCRGEFHDPSVPTPPAAAGEFVDGGGKKRSVGSSNSKAFFIPRRVSRSLIDECCKNPCRKSTVLKYCKHPKGTESERGNSLNAKPIPLGPNTEVSPTTSQLPVAQQGHSYFAPLHIGSFIQRLFGNGNVNSVSRTERERDPLLPLARVQDNPNIPNPSSLQVTPEEIITPEEETQLENNLDRMANSLASLTNHHHHRESFIDPEDYYIPPEDYHIPPFNKDPLESDSKESQKEEDQPVFSSRVITTALPSTLIPLGPHLYNQFEY